MKSYKIYMYIFCTDPPVTGREGKEKMKKRKEKCLPFLAMICTAVMLFSVLSSFSCMIGATEVSSVWDSDYSDTVPSESVRLSPAYLLELLTGTVPIEEEAEYLNSYAELGLTVSDRLRGEWVTLSLDGTDVTVTAIPRVYTAKNGERVSWVPVTVTYGENSFPMTAYDGGYRVKISGVSEETGETVTVQYRCELTIPKDIANRLFTSAWEDAATAEEKAPMEDYRKALEAYRAYLESISAYRENLMEYREYLEKQAEWQVEQARYEAYVSALKQYEIDLAAWQLYRQQYAAYLQSKAEYDKAYEENREKHEAYLQYLNNLNKIRKSMAAIESLFVVPDMEGITVQPLFGALQNAELIVMFEKYKSGLAMYGVKDSDITEMRSSSDKLNRMLQEYADARAVSEEAAFAYYSRHYSEIAGLFRTLYDRMMSIMSGTLFNHLCAKIELEYGRGDVGKYKKWRVKNVLAHIYLICQCLDDSVQAQSEWKFFAETGEAFTYQFGTLLGQNVIMTDTNSSDPAGLQWLAPVEDAVLPEVLPKPEEVMEPLRPAEVVKPVRPEPVAEPKEPEEVREPALPTEGDFALVWRTDRLVEARKEGKLPKREKADGDQTIVLYRNMEKPIPFSDEALVCYYGYDGTLLGFHKISEPILSATALLAEFFDEQYRYHTPSWSLSPDSNQPFAGECKESVCLYGFYQKETRSYEITFVTENESQTVNCRYGEIPVCTLSTEKMSTHDKNYSFAGWYPLVETARRDAVYTAQYVETERLYRIVWQTREEEIVTYSGFGRVPSAPAVRAFSYEGGVRYAFGGWDSEILPVTGDTCYIARYTAEPLVGEDAELTVTQTGITVGQFGNELSVELLFRIAVGEGKSVMLRFDSADLSLDRAAVASLAASDVRCIRLLQNAEGAVSLLLEDSSGNSLAPAGEVRLYLPADTASGGSLTVIAQDGMGESRTVPCKVNDGMVEFPVSAGMYYQVDRQYTLRVETSDGGTVMLDKSRYHAGAPVPIKVYFASEYTVSRLTLVKNATGEETPLESLDGFVMPAYDATLKIDFAQKVYKIEFVSMGEVIATLFCHMGDDVTPPAIPTSFEKDGYCYHFIGWSSPVAIATEDMVYTAKYHIMPAGGSMTGEGWAWKSVLLQFVLPGGLTVIAIGLTVWGYVWMRKKRKWKGTADRETVGK